MNQNTPTLWIPGSKSQTIRALLINSFARGKSSIINPLSSSDTLSTVKALESLGVVFQMEENVWHMDSTKLGEGLKEATLDMGNSGTGTYLLTGLAASLGIPVTIGGDESLNSRPVGPLLKAYEELGCSVESSGGYPPFTIKGPIKGGKVTVECRTSQYLSSLMLACPYGEKDSEIECSLLWEKPYVTLTKEHLERNNIVFSMTDDYMDTKIKGNQSFRAMDYTVKGDWSSATFFLVLAMLMKKPLTLMGLDKNDSQGDRRVLEILSAMGASIDWIEGGLTITGPERMKGGRFDINDMPDSLPALSILGAHAETPLTLYNAPQVRIKETDRIVCMRENLEKCGIRCEELPDGITVYPSSCIKSAEVKGYDDHRIIMAMAVLAATEKEKIMIDDTAKCSVTFPSFFTLLSRATENSQRKQI